MSSLVQRVARETDAAVAEAMRRAAMLGEGGVTSVTPLDDLIAKEEGYPCDEYAARVEGVVAFLDFLMEKGPHPHHVMQRLYGYLRAAAPHRLRAMSGRQIAAIFGETRAAESARTKMLCDRIVAQAGYRATAMPYQKSEAAREKYRAAQLGNRNRAGTGKGGKRAVEQLREAA